MNIHLQDNNERNNNQARKSNNKKKDANTPTPTEAPNFEKLYISIAELKNESNSTFTMLNDFFREYLSKNENSSTNDILAFIEHYHENENIIKNSKDLFFKIIFFH